jgi:aminoglycoside phosphotransferase (APT) family kinase protein
MTRDSQRDVFERLTQAAIPGGHLVHVWPLEGGVSAHVTAMEVAGPDGVTHNLVVREHGKLDRKSNPHIARDEYRLLKLLTEQELAVPAPIYLDPDSEFFDNPCLVLNFVTGDANFAPGDLAGYLMQMAGHLSLIHKLDCASHDLSFLPSIVDLGTRLIAAKGGNGVAAPIDNLKDILENLDGNWPPAQMNDDVLLHRDFWPGNLVCEGDRIVGVIDWEDAHIGDPLADLANSRMEVLWAFGRDAMTTFTEHYIRNSKPDVTALPYWDLNAALRHAGAFAGWAADHPDRENMRDQHRYFVEQAIEKLQ